MANEIKRRKKKAQRIRWSAFTDRLTNIKRDRCYSLDVGVDETQNVQINICSSIYRNTYNSCIVQYTCAIIRFVSVKIVFS